MKAVLCPVCNGTGKIKKKTCHGCDGKGWVEVHEQYCPYPYCPDSPRPQEKPWYLPWNENYWR